MRLSLRALFVLTFIVALVFGLSRIVGETWFRGMNFLPPLAALLWAGYLAITTRWQQQPLGFKRAALAGAAIAVPVAAALLVTVAADLARMRYWDWQRDWPIALEVLLVHTVLGAAVGCSVELVRRGCWRLQ